MQGKTELLCISQESLWEAFCVKLDCGALTEALSGQTFHALQDFFLKQKNLLDICLLLASGLERHGFLLELVSDLLDLIKGEVSRPQEFYQALLLLRKGVIGPLVATAPLRLQGLVVQLLQPLVELEETLVQGLRVHIEKLILRLVLRDHVEGEHHGALRLVVHNIISFNHCYLVLIEDVLEGLELGGMAIRLVTTLRLLFQVSPSCQGWGRLIREELCQPDLNLGAWRGCFRVICLANFQVIVGLSWLCRF